MSIRANMIVCLAAVTLLWFTTAVGQSLEFGPPYTLSGSFENPFGVAVNGAQGHLLVSDTRNRQIHWATLTSLSGTPTFKSFGFVADPAQPGALIDPQGLAADSNGHVYVVDARRNQVNLYTWNSTTSTYEIDLDFTSTTRNAVAGVAIESPRDVAVGTDGKVYLLDSGRKRVLRADGPADTSWEVFKSDPSLGNAYGMDVGPDGRLYVADTDHHRIVRYEADGTSTSLGHFGTGAAEFRFPRDVAVDINGRIYVADTNNHRLELLDANGHHLLSLGRAPTFAFVQKVALDAERRLYIADSDRNAIIAFLGHDVPVPFDGWIRDYVDDSGAQPSDPSFKLASPDILVRHNSDVDMAAAQTKGLESIAFENPRCDQDNQAYVAVRNRGTQDLRDAVVMLYWADQAGALAFPVDWKTDGFFNGPAPTAVSNRLEVPPVPPGGMVVLDPLRFRPPPPESARLRNGAFVLGARLVQPFDVALSAAGLEAVRASNNVAIHPISVVRGSVYPATLTFHINSCSHHLAIQRETVKIMNTSATAFEVSISLDNRDIYPNWHKFGLCETGASECTDTKLEKKSVPPKVVGNDGELAFSVEYKPETYGSDHTTALNFHSTFIITPVPITGSFDRANLDCVEFIDICQINPNLCFLQEICWLCPIWENPLAWIINPVIIVSLLFLPALVWGMGRYLGATYQTTGVRRIVAVTGFATVAVGGMIGAGILITATAFAVVGALRK